MFELYKVTIKSLFLLFNSFCLAFFLIDLFFAFSADLKLISNNTL